MRKLGLLNVLLAFTIFAVSGVSCGAGEIAFDLKTGVASGTTLSSDQVATNSETLAAAGKQITVASSSAIIGTSDALTGSETMKVYTGIGNLTTDGTGTLTSLIFGGSDVATVTPTIAGFKTQDAGVNFSLSMGSIFPMTNAGVLIVGGKAKEVTIAGTVSTKNLYVLGTEAGGSALNLDNFAFTNVTGGSLNVLSGAAGATLTVNSIDLSTASTDATIALTSSAGQTAKFVYDGDLTLDGAKTTITFTGTGAANGAAVFQVNGNLDLGVLNNNATHANGALKVVATAPAAGVARQAFVVGG